MLSCHANVLQSHQGSEFALFLKSVPSAISLHSQLTRERAIEKKKKRKSKSAKTTSSGRPAKRAFVSSLRNCQVYPTSFCSYSCSTMDVFHHYICSDISFDLICQLLHWAPWYSPSPLARGIRLINQAGLLCVRACLCLWRRERVWPQRSKG